MAGRQAGRQGGRGEGGKEKSVREGSAPKGEEHRAVGRCLEAGCAGSLGLSRCLVVSQDGQRRWLHPSALSASLLTLSARLYSAPCRHCPSL